MPLALNNVIVRIDYTNKQKLDLVNDFCDRLTNALEKFNGATQEFDEYANIEGYFDPDSFDAVSETVATYKSLADSSGILILDIHYQATRCKAWTFCGDNADWSCDAWHYGLEAPNTRDGDLYVIDTEQAGEGKFQVVRYYPNRSGDNRVKAIADFADIDTAKKFALSIER